MKQLVFLALLRFITSRARDVEVRWDFDEGLQGWARSTSTEMDMEVSIGGGQLRGAIHGLSPHIDSPRLDLECNGKHHVVFRMAYTGFSTMGRLVLKDGPGLIPLQHIDETQSLWTVRPSLTVLASSSNQSAKHYLVDNDGYTVWSSQGSTDQWITLDAGAVLPITRVEIDITRDQFAPRNMRLEKSLDGGARTYHSVTRFSITTDDSATRLNQTDQYTYAFQGFQDWSRYWRLYIEDNFGGPGIKIREIRLLGPEQGLTNVDFNIVPDGKSHTYYVPIHEHFRGTLTQLRLYPASEVKAVTGITPGSRAPRLGESFSLDWLAIVKAPTIRKVIGCLDKYYKDDSDLTQGLAYSNLSMVTTYINQYLPQYSTQYGSNADFPYATTYNCYQPGGQRVTITGINLGQRVNITVGGSPCTQLQVLSEQTEVTCILPPGRESHVMVQISNAAYPGLNYAASYLSYQVAPPVPLQPMVFNIQACSVDLSWEPSGDSWDHVTITGYKIRWRQGAGTSHVKIFEGSVGNITTTTVNGLLPGEQYDFAVAAMADNQADVAWQRLDLYGRRPPVRDAVSSSYSTPTNVTSTLPFDFIFHAFDANSTLSHGPWDRREAQGPTGVIGGEGHYGLILLGDANIENCNVSYACCDGYNATVGTTSCTARQMCSAIGTLDLEYEDGLSARAISTNNNNTTTTTQQRGGINNKQIRLYHDPLVAHPQVTPSLPCGPALRLTPSHARFTGAAWYGRQVEVREGFETTFHFRVTNPSIRCNIMDDEYTHCRSRGSDGFAFVVQVESDHALGQGGMGLGYQEINNSLAVEFDTYFNYELLEPYENHISVNTQGWRHPNTASHSSSLASSTHIPDLANGRVHVARIRYEPMVDESVILTASFQAPAPTFFTDAEFPNGGQADWGIGTGQLSIWVDDLLKPVLITPLNLDATLHLNNGRAFVGFTAATGEDTWEVHDILDWTFTSLRRDPAFHYPSVVVNGVGAYQCTDTKHCVHP